LLDNGKSRSDMVAEFMELSLTLDLTPANFPTLSAVELAAAIERQDLITNKAEVAVYFTKNLGTKTNIAEENQDNPTNDSAYLASIQVISGVNIDRETVSSSIEKIKSLLYDTNAITIILNRWNELQTSPPLILSLITDMQNIKMNDVLSPNMESNLTLRGLTDTNTKISVNTSQGVQEVTSVVISTETQSISFAAPVSIMDGELSIASFNSLTTIPYIVVTSQTPYLNQVIPEVVKVEDNVVLSGVNLPIIPVDIVFEGQESSFTQTVTPSSSESVSFTVPQGVGSGSIYLQMSQIQTNRLYLSVKRNIDIKVVLDNDIDINSSDISLVWGGEEYPLNENFMATLPLENSDAQYINVMVQLANNERSILYSAVITQDTTQITTLNAESTAIAWTLQGLGATAVSENNLLSSLYDTIASNEKVQELADYIAILQKEDINTWASLNDTIVEQKLRDALVDILQNQRQVSEAQMLVSRASIINPLVAITQTPEDNDIYIENRKSDGSVWIVNDSRLFLSVEVTSKEEDKEYSINYKHPSNFTDMEFAKGIISPKGWPIFGISSEKKIELKGIDSSLEIVVGAYGSIADKKIAQVSDILKARTVIDGILVPAFNSILSTLIDRSIPKNYQYKNVIKGLGDIYDGDIVAQLLESVSNKNTTRAILVDTYLVKPLINNIVACSTNPTGTVCQNTAKGLLKLSGITSDTALRTLAAELANKLKNELIKDSVLAQLAHVGLVARAAEFVWDHLGDISNGISISESIYDMNNYPQVINADIEFALEIEEVTPLCVVISPETQEVTFELKGEGFSGGEGKVASAFLTIGNQEIQSDNTVAFDEGRQLDALFSSPQSLVTGGSVEDASLFIKYDEGLYMMYPEWIKIIDSTDTIVYFDSIVPSSAYKGAIVTLEGCGWIPLDDIKVYFSGQDSLDYVEAEVLSSTADKIEVKVPDTAKSGTVYLTAGNKETRKLLFDINPFSLNDPEEDDTLIKGSWVALSGQALTQATKIYFIDHTGNKIEGTITNNSEYSLKATIPEGLAYGIVGIYVEDNEGIVTNEIVLPLVPSGVNATPSSGIIGEGISVTLSLDEGTQESVVAYYRLNEMIENNEVKYSEPLFLTMEDLEYTEIYLYTFARVIVNDIAYDSAVRKFIYSPCDVGYDLNLNGECISKPLPLLVCPISYNGAFEESGYDITVNSSSYRIYASKQPYYYTNCEYGENEQLKTEEFIEDSKKTGVWKYYFSSGQLWREVSYLNNEKNGFERRYFESGELSAEYHYINDKYDGTNISYLSSGKLYFIMNYKEGLLDGLYMMYDSFSEHLKREGYYIQGKKIGEWKEYNGFGNLRFGYFYNSNGIIYIKEYYSTVNGATYLSKREYYDDDGILTHTESLWVFIERYPDNIH
ncbi:MAG: antitoxin component YwqK of YwqJK toxin-antitoxin module, partial [Sulfurimonas sp.]|uniref:toxin-antitoxin system YwqK family antitoxin n=1 Tax=Sulfurimonas sp. TaxID=2022749 RepID=UPI0039E31671